MKKSKNKILIISCIIISIIVLFVLALLIFNSIKILNIKDGVEFPDKLIFYGNLIGSLLTVFTITGTLVAVVIEVKSNHIENAATLDFNTNKKELDKVKECISNFIFQYSRYDLLRKSTILAGQGQKNEASLLIEEVDSNMNKACTDLFIFTDIKIQDTNADWFDKITEYNALKKDLDKKIIHINNLYDDYLNILQSFYLDNRKEIDDNTIKMIKDSSDNIKNLLDGLLVDFKQYLELKDKMIYDLYKINF